MLALETGIAVLWIGPLTVNPHAPRALVPATRMRSPNWSDLDEVSPSGTTTFDIGSTSAGVGFVAPEEGSAPLPADDTSADMQEVAAGTAAGVLETVVLVVSIDRDRVVESAHQLCRWIRNHLQQWLTDERFIGDRLVAVTRAAVVADPREATMDLDAATVWGLVRSMQSENSGRAPMIDIDPGTASARLTALQGICEAQQILCSMTIRAARMTRVVTNIGAEGTVVVSGGTGRLGRVAAWHLVEIDVRELFLLSRRGMQAEGASELVEDRLQTLPGPAQPTALVFDYTSPARLLTYLGEHLGNDAAPIDTLPVLVASDEEPLVIACIACRLSGEVHSSEEVWDLVGTGGDGIGPLPGDRGWDLDRTFDLTRSAGSSTQLAGFLSEADAGFFGVSLNNALAMDAPQRLLLPVARETVERADVEPASLAGAPAGVYVGFVCHDYPAHTRYDPRRHCQRCQSAPDRLWALHRSAALGLQGPVTTAGVACSSSPVTMQLVGQAPYSLECALAPVSGVTVVGSPRAFVELGRQDGLAGRCKAFAEAAECTGGSEGAVVLERHSAACQHGHPALQCLCLESPSVMPVFLGLDHIHFRGRHSGVVQRPPGHPLLGWAARRGQSVVGPVLVGHVTPHYCSAGTRGKGRPDLVSVVENGYFLAGQSFYLLNLLNGEDLSCMVLMILRL